MARYSESERPEDASEQADYPTESSKVIIQHNDLRVTRNVNARFRRLIMRGGAPASRRELITVALVAAGSLTGNILSLFRDYEGVSNGQTLKVLLLVVSIASVALLIIAYFDRAAKIASAESTLLTIREFRSYSLTGNEDPVYVEAVVNMADAARRDVANMLASGNRDLGYELSHSIQALMNSTTVLDEKDIEH